jgi:hypothetical protein
MCPEGKVALLETGGSFQLKFFPISGEPVVFTEELEEEFI